MRARVRPSVLSPGKLSVLVAVTLNPKRFLVFPGLDKAEVVKWAVVAKLGLMQATPLKNKDEDLGSATQ